MTTQTAISPLAAGLRCRCPRCGKGALFEGFLTVRQACSVCGLDYGFADAGDGPAFFIMTIVGFIVTGGALIVEIMYQPPYWVHAVIWPTLAIVLSLAVLRPLKATLIALQYYNKAEPGRLDDRPL